MHCNTLNSATEYHFIHKKSNIQFHQLVFLVYHFSDTHSIHILLGNFRNFHQPALIPKTMTATSGPIWRPGKAFRVISCTTLSELLITTLPDWTQIQPFMKRIMLSIMFCRRRNQYNVLNRTIESLYFKIIIHRVTKIRQMCLSTFKTFNSHITSASI